MMIGGKKEHEHEHEHEQEYEHDSPSKSHSFLESDSDSDSDSHSDSDSDSDSNQKKDGFAARLERKLNREKIRQKRKLTYNIFLALIIIFVIANYCGGGDSIYSLLALGCYCVLLTNRFYRF